MKNVKILLLLGVMLVNVMPYLKDGKVEWKTTQVEAQTYTCEEHWGNTHKCVNIENPNDPNDYFYWKDHDCDVPTVTPCYKNCNYCNFEYLCGDTCKNMECPQKTRTKLCDACFASLDFNNKCINCSCTRSSCYVNPTGGGNTTQQPSTPADPCANSNTISTEAQTSLNNIMSNYDPTNFRSFPLNITPDPNNTLRLNNLQSYATASTTTTEIAFVVAQYRTFSGTNYYYTEGITQGNNTSVIIPTYVVSVATFHNHTKGSSTTPNLTGPSPGDFLSLLKNIEAPVKTSPNEKAGNLKDAYIYSYDGSVYDLHVTDPSAVTTFFNNNKNTVFTDVGMENNKQTFETGSSLRTTYDEIFSAAKSEKMSESQAHDYAMAYIMKQAGISLLKKDPGTDTSFKKMNADTTPPSNDNKKPYTFTKCN